MVKSAIIAISAIVIIIVASFSIYAGSTYPRTIVTVPVSFTIGADKTTTTFSQPFLTDKVQVEVSVQSGASLWKAQILNGDQIIWEHSAGQSEQTSYKSDWVALPSGSYNFTFAAIGVGSLNAKATLTCKGGFW